MEITLIGMTEWKGDHMLPREAGIEEGGCRADVNMLARAQGYTHAYVQ